MYIASVPLPDNGFIIIKDNSSLGMLNILSIGENIYSRISIPYPTLNIPIAKNIPNMYGAILYVVFIPSNAPLIKLSYMSIPLYFPYTIIVSIISGINILEKNPSQYLL